MIYLILTASIQDRFGKYDPLQREQQYKKAITETLRLLPAAITPILVENNGERPTYLDGFTHQGKPIPVLYTKNNSLTYRNKGVNELLDIKTVICNFGIKPTDMIIKLTGRYYPRSTFFFEQVMQEADHYDMFIKYYDVDRCDRDLQSCVLGCYAMRCKWLLLLNPITVIGKNDVPEKGFTYYVQFSGAKVKEMDNLDVQCVFSDTFRQLVV
jgi:hypothetical protein